MKAKPGFLFTALAGATGLALISLASPSNALAATKRYTRNFTVDAVGFLNPGPVVVNVPTMGVVELLGCFGPPQFSIRTRLLSFEDAQPFFGVGAVTGSDLPSGVNPAGVVSDQTAGTFQSGGGSPLIVNDGDSLFGTSGHWEWSLWRANGDNKRGAHVSTSPNWDSACAIKYPFTGSRFECRPFHDRIQHHAGFGSSDCIRLQPLPSP